MTQSEVPRRRNSSGAEMGFGPGYFRLSHSVSRYRSGELPRTRLLGRLAGGEGDFATATAPVHNMVSSVSSALQSCHSRAVVRSHISLLGASAAVAIG